GEGDPMRIGSPTAGGATAVRRTLAVVATAVVALGLGSAPATGQGGDPRADLGAGWMDAEEASSGLALLAHLDKPEGFVHPDAFDNPAQIGSIAHANSDLA